MNNIFPTVATTVKSVYTDKTIICITDASGVVIDDTVIADSVCINIIDDNTDPIILTNVVNNENENYCKMNSYKCCCIIIILFVIGLFLV